MRLLDRPDVRALGVRVAILTGKLVPRPIPPSAIETLEDIEVVDTDEGRSGFQMTFRLERQGIRDIKDYPQLRQKAFKPFHRVMIAAWLGARPRVLMNGAITQLDHDPVNKRLVVTGEDLAVVMDREERNVAHIGMTPEIMVRTILTKYAKYKITPGVTRPTCNKVPLRWPQQHGTDLRFLETLAAKNGFVFYLEPGPVPGVTTAYWGPAKRAARPQPALKVDMGGISNVESISFSSDSAAPTKIVGAVKDPQTGSTVPINTIRSTRAPLSQGELFGSPRATRLHAFDGETWLEELARAQAETNRSTDEVVVAQGELDTIQYGSVLHARGTVGIQGVGSSHDGDYYVKRVTHKISNGSYTQSFTLTRGGSGSLKPVVRS